MTQILSEVIMKGITVILILSMFLSFFACTSTKKITQKDDIKTTFESDNRFYQSLDNSFYLYTDDFDIYYFNSPYQLQISNDRLVGRGQVVTENSLGSREHVKIAVENISKIEVEEFDGVKTTIFIGAVAATVYLFYYIGKSSLENMQVLGE